MCAPPKCQCKQGYLRDKITQKCIHPSTCKPPTPTLPTCQPNESLNPCGACDNECDNNRVLTKRCHYACRSPECQCKAGYIRDRQSGQCILETQCERNIEIFIPGGNKKCPVGEKWNECGAEDGCERTCDRPG